MGYSIKPGIKRGRPPLKYTHGRPLTSTERVKAMRAKRDLDKYSFSHPKYKRAFEILESLYSEGVNPHKFGDLRTKLGALLLIHGYGYKDTIEGREHASQEKKWDRKEKFRRVGAGRPSLRGKAMSSSQRVFRHRLRRKLGIKK
jgi:hypothetical protein